MHEVIELGLLDALAGTRLRKPVQRRRARVDDGPRLRAPLFRAGGLRRPQGPSALERQALRFRPQPQSHRADADQRLDHPSLRRTLPIAHGIPELPVEIETVSDSFGRALLRQSDAIWIISEDVVIGDLIDGTLERLPVDTSETRGSVGLATRADVEIDTAAAILARTVRETVARLRL